MRHSFIFVAALAAAAWPGHSSAQSLAERVTRADSPRVQFTYSARPGACGNGRSFVQVGGGTWIGNFSEGERRDACEAGPS
jgi:hypothetical protein